MMRPFWSLLLCSVLMWTTIGHLSYVHDAYIISLHITLVITICVYCNFYIIYRIFVNTAMRQTTSFEALYSYENLARGP